MFIILSYPILGNTCLDQVVGPFHFTFAKTAYKQYEENGKSILPFYLHGIYLL